MLNCQYHKYLFQLKLNFHFFYFYPKKNGSRWLIYPAQTNIKYQAGLKS